MGLFVDPTLDWVTGGAANRSCGTLNVKAKTADVFFKRKLFLFFMNKSVNRNAGRGKMKTRLFSVLFSAFFCVVFFLSCTHKETKIETETVREPAAEKRRPATLRFEECRSNRNYLETKIASMPSDYLRTHEEEWTTQIPMRCIQAAQKNFSGNYAFCSSSTARPVPNAKKPCLTENYSTLMYNAFQDTMDCFNLDPKDFFLQIMIESGFHVNAINKKGWDSGLTQFTANGIKRVTANNLVERTRRILLESSRPSCQRISNIVGHFDISLFEVKNRCTMIATPENPYRSMLFNYLHTMLDTISVESIVDDFPEVKAIMNDRIKRHLVYLAYNRGITGVKRLIKGYVDSRKAVNHEIIAEDFKLDQNLSDVKSILNLSRQKRDKLKSYKKIRNLSFAEYVVIFDASYLSDMTRASEYVKNLLGDECGGL